MKAKRVERREHAMEIWRDIEGFDGYQVSSFGRVRSLRIRSDSPIKPMMLSGKILKQSLDKNGYSMVWLYKNGIRFTCKVHRLVANAFIPNTECKPQIDHINTIRNDNNVENLRWVTASENMLNPLSLKRNIQHLTGGKNGHARRIVQLSNAGDIIMKWDCINDAVRALGINNHSHIVQVCNGERQQAYGFKWEYAI